MVMTALSVTRESKWNLQLMDTLGCASLSFVERLSSFSSEIHNNIGKSTIGTLKVSFVES